MSNETSYQFVQVNQNNHIYEITLARPEKRNALTSEFIRELRRAFAHASSETRVIHLKASGDQAFCAGADLQEIATVDGKNTFFRLIAELVDQMLSVTVPIVTAVKGHALAGGLGLVAASDIILAAPDAIFGLPEVRLGILPAVVMVPLARTVQLRALQELIITGDFINAERAQEIGLITRISAGDLEQEANDLCQKIAALPSSATGSAKSLINLAVPEISCSTLLCMSDKVAKLSMTPEVDERIAQFLKR